MWARARIYWLSAENPRGKTDAELALFVANKADRMTTPEIEVRPARESEASDVLALIRAKADFDGFLHTVKMDERSLREMLFSTPRKVKMLVALVDGALVGLVTYYDIYSTFLAKPGIRLDDLYVHEPHRGCGVGKALLIELCRVARSTGCARIDWVVSRDNDDARAFYEQLGAKIYEDVRHARLDDNAIASARPRCLPRSSRVLIRFVSA